MAFNLGAVLSLKDSNFTSNLNKGGKGVDTFRNRVLHAQNGMKRFEKSVRASATGVVRSVAGMAMAYVGISSVKTYLSEAMTAAMENEKIYAQLDAVLKSTGGTAGMTKSSIKSLTDQMNMNTIISKGAIVEGENLLLTFTNIGKKTFPQAVETMLDMSQALGQDTKVSAIQLGKALNDPTRGITALRRVGVSFNKQQEEQIKKMQKSGNIMGAQKAILAELTKEFGGSAKAQTQTEAGKQILIEKQMKSFKSQIGSALLPFRRDFYSIVLKGMPYIKQGMTSVIKAINSGYETLRSRYLDNQKFKKLSLTGKIDFVVNDVSMVIDEWLKNGGTETLKKYGKKAGEFMVQGVETAAPTIAKAGVKIGGLLAQGIWDGMKDSPLAQSALGAYLGFKVGGPVGGVAGGFSVPLALSAAKGNFSSAAMLGPAGVFTWEASKLYNYINGNKKPGKNARGTNYWRGGPTWVGEKGPELVDLPQGSKVIPNNKVASVQKEKSVTVINNFYGLTVDEAVDKIAFQVKLRLANS